MSPFFIVSFFIESFDMLSLDIESFDMLSLDMVSFFISSAAKVRLWLHLPRNFGLRRSRKAATPSKHLCFT